MNTKIGKWVVTSVVALVLLLACIKEEPIIHVTSVTLEKNELELTEGDNHKLSVIVLPEDATNASVSWESSNTDVATVDAKGLITALKPGTVEITVTTEDGEKTAVCKVTVAPRFIHVVSVSISPEKLTLIEGETHSLTTTVLPAEATNPKVMWSSADSTIATVNEMGELTALKAGVVTITATSEDGAKTALCEVTVEAKIIEVESVRLSEEQITLVEGNTYSLTATVLPADATNKNIHWTSENEAVVTINEGGFLTAHKVGTATVVVTTESGKKTAICRVTVEAKVIAVESVSLSEEQITLVEGNTYSLTATVLPANATNKKVTWTSANTAIATVDDLGKVTGVASGTVYITATTKDSKKTASCKVTVSKKVITVAYVSLDNETITLLEGDTKTLVATVSPTNATNKKITWTTTDKTIATVDANGKVTAITAGVVSITATTEDGGKKASCRVTVEKNIVAVTNVSIQPESIVLAIGNQRQLSATVSPTNATNKKVTWTSADPSIATVTANGKVTGVASGTVYITATTEDGGKKASCKVTVESVIAVTNVSIQPETITLPVGDELQLTATVSPTNATNKKVTWTTANAGIAKVDNHGKVTGVASGTVYITATTEDGGKTATCKVSVTTPIIQVTSINIQPGTATVTVGGEQQLTANVLPTNATNKTVTWTSGNTSIATVSSSGKVTGVASGTVYITATTEDGSKTATCKVTVTASSVIPDGARISGSVLTGWDCTKIPADGKVIIPANVTIIGSRAFAQCKRLKEVVIHGNVNMIGEEAFQNCTALNKVTIAEGMKRIETSAFEGCSSLQSIVLPATLENIGPRLFADTPSLVSITVKAPAPPRTYALYSLSLFGHGNKNPFIYVPQAYVDTYKNDPNWFWSEYRDRIFPMPNEGNTPSVQVTSVELSSSSLILRPGSIHNLLVRILPTNATNQAITWATSNAEIATVHGNGIVTAIGVGKAQLTATTVDGGKIATCFVTVRDDDTPRIVMKAISNSITLIIDAAPEDRNDIWIDFNNDGQKDTNENVTTFGHNLISNAIIQQPFPEKTVTIYGKVTFLKCTNNNLTSLDVSKNTNLTFLDCSGNNQLYGLDITKNTNLTFLDCSGNQLYDLDITKNTNLSELICRQNQLTNLDVSKNTNLKSLDCWNNTLTDLDVTKNTNLNYLNCMGNRLTSLDVSKNANLIQFVCSVNQLTSLDITKNTNLTLLICGGNQLSNLNITKNTELQRFDCHSNQLTDLDISKNAKLNHITIINNNLTPASKQKIVDDLPTRSASEQAKFNNYNYQDFSQSQLNAIRAKGWTVVN
ncbi:Ig-like domain-containing protein [Capnocytophaga canis]|uniref:Ig-like domain-containing protein n=1 Tax=Capnocytophaga canis TaxID=1848903 RepID=UPI001561BDD9|nr:Ig-like domain-containing protein [Capnocytophaga canis]